MSEYTPIATLAEFELLCKEQLVDGYMAGLRQEPEPGSDKSRAFWHGWRIGMMDNGALPIDAPARQLAEEIVRKQRAH